MRGFAFAVFLLTASNAAAQGEFWCWNADEVHVAVASDTVRITHLAALYNCCPDPIVYDVQVGDATIFVEEQTQSPCDCDCCTNTGVTLDDVPPGPWILRFRWFDLEISDWTEEEFQIEVPDVGQGYEPVVARQSWDDCLNEVAVPESQIDGKAIRIRPNPTTSYVEFSFLASERDEITLQVFDVSGRLVDTVRRQAASDGIQTLIWSPGRDVAAGIYYARLGTSDHQVTRRFVLLR